MSQAAEIKKIFKEHGLAPKKWMGQNLLVDRSYLSRIVREAAVEPDAAIVEVGAGLGVMTEELANRGARVWALELDSGFARVLDEKFGQSEQVTLIHADALKYDFRSLAARIGKLRVVANLPYNISSRLLFLFHENREVFSTLHILLQREVAERLIAEPGTKDYGVLTVLLALEANVDILFDIPPRAFYPVPGVVSSLVRIEFLETPRLPVRDTLLLTRLIKASFASRRKTLKNTVLKTAIPGVSGEDVAAAAEKLGLDLQRRGETLTPEEFYRFAEEVAQQSSLRRGLGQS
jgi:16S rRNA (adenine1518-N6/adenine1519-N6)-dimethyltransferase